MLKPKSASIRVSGPQDSYNPRVANLSPTRRRPLAPRLTLVAFLLLGLAWAHPAHAQFFLPGSSSLTSIPSGTDYDAADLHLAADGSIWTTSQLGDVILKLSPDGKTVTRWKMVVGTGPSSLLPNPDGTFWVTESGVFNIARFDPATGTLTEWVDYARRPTTLILRPDGKFWLPETGGSLCLFDPAAGTLTYYQSTAISSMAYGFLDDDGTIWTCDFIGNYLLKITADGTKAERYVLPDVVTYPSKIIRGFDGALWISAYGSGQLLRFEPATLEMKVFDLTLGSLPYDLHNYKDRILFSEQAYANVGFLDPSGATPSLTTTLTKDTVEPEFVPVVRTSIPVTTVLTSTDDTIEAPPVAINTGNKSAGLTEYPAGVGSNWGLAIDEARGRILFATKAYIGALMPGIPGTDEDLYFPSAASVRGASAIWRTQVVAWNRATADSAGVKSPLPIYEQLLPNGWISGYAPTANPTIGVDQLIFQDDAIGIDMEGPDSFGGLRLVTASTGSAADLAGWARVYTTRPDGGTYGFAMNPIKPPRSVTAGDTGYFFTPPDVAQRTSGGFLVVNAATGTASLVAPDGTTLASKTFSWPGGTHVQYSPLFGSFGVAPVASARFVVKVDVGRVMPYGSSIDPITFDPINLEYLRASDAVTLQWLPAVARGAGPLGSAARTDVQLFNPSASTASVTLAFRSGTALGGLPTTTVTVPSGVAVTLIDVLHASMGLDGVAGILDVLSDQPVSAFARVRATDASGGGWGYGLAGHSSADSVVAGSRGVFLADTDSGWDVIGSDLVLANIADTPVTVALNLTTYDGKSAGTTSVTLARKEVRTISGPWYTISGSGASFGRLDVVPSDASAAVFATLLRQDRKTGDTDAILPVLVPK